MVSIPDSVQAVSFSISGEWLTNQVRSLWAAEGEPLKALLVLRDGLPTMEEQDRLAILIGKKKLVGDNEVELVDDDATEIYGEPLSMDAVLQQQDNTAEVEQWKDLYQIATYDVVRVASPIGMIEIPRWRASAYRAGNVTIDDIPYEECAKTAEPNTPWLKKEEEEDPKPEATDTIDHHSGWLSTEGRFYSCGWMEHLWLLSRLGQDDLEAEKVGWIKISGQYAWSHYHLHGTGRKPTQRQIDMVFDWCVENQHDLPHWLRAKGTSP